MGDDFQKTVDLKSQKKALGNEAELKARLEKRPEAKKIKRQSRADGVRELSSKRRDTIDEFYSEKQAGYDLRKFNQPKEKKSKEIYYKQIIIILSIFLAGSLIYGVFFRPSMDEAPSANQPAEAAWYAVKLVNNEVYYGQIRDTAVDPIVINNVYYDYDQIEREEGKKAEITNLRLVKRGKETHGPEGSMNIVRSQVLYMEPLKQDSKVLKAILDYEQ